MSNLKREALSNEFDRTLSWMLRAVALPFLMILSYLVGSVRGYDAGFDHAAGIAVESAARHDARADACGIQDPLSCTLFLVESVVDLFRPEPEFTVKVTPTHEVVCASAERAYWACVHDADCPLETLETIADDVNVCQTPR